MKVFLVGGAVRDMLLGKTPHDRDYVVFGSSPEEMEKLGFHRVGKQFPVFLHPVTGEEYALARREEKTGSGHRGFEFVFTPDVTPEEDVARRDFTCNALLYDESSKKIIDLAGGETDIKNHILRHVDSTHFVEDPLRVLRMCRFAAKLRFDIAPETMELAKDMVQKGMLSELSAERIWGEIESALRTDNFAQFMLYLRQCGALDVIMPEAGKLWQSPERLDYHPEGNTGAHTVLALRQAENMPPRVKFAVLLHDIGKITTPALELPHHHGHDKAAAPLINEICRRLKVPNGYRNFALAAAAYHMRLHIVSVAGAKSLLSLLEGICGLKNRYDLLDFLRVCKCDMLGRQRAVSEDELSLFRRSALRLITNFKIQSRIKASDMPGFDGMPKNSMMAEKLHEYRLEKIV